MKITILISLLVAAYAVDLPECDDYGNVNGDGVWYWEEDTNTTECKLVFCIRQEKYDSNGAITRTYGVREYWSVPDKWTIKDHCEDESNRGFACAESDLVYPDTCGCPSCPSCEKSMDDCPNTDATYTSVVYANDETCEIDYSPCCKQACEDGTYVYGDLNDLNECVRDGACTPAPTKDEATATPCEEFACPDGTPGKGWQLTADADCNYPKDDCCLNECYDSSLIYGTLKTSDDDGSYYCYYDADNICPEETTKTPCDVDFEYCPDGTPAIKVYADDSCSFNFDDCCKDECDNGNGYIYGTLDDAGTCVYDSDGCTKAETTQTPDKCSDDKYICCNGYKKSECYVDENIEEPDSYCSWQFEEYDGLGCTDDTYACPGDGTSPVDDISRNDCCMFEHYQCCIIECEDITYSGYLDEYDDGTTTCVYKNDAGQVMEETPTCDTETDPTTSPETTKESECIDLICRADVFTCPEGGDVDYLTYDDCCMIEEDACCIRKCESDDGDSATQQGVYMSNDEGAYCAYEYDCGQCPEDTRTCDNSDNGVVLVRNIACEFDYSECCEEEEGCKAVGYENDDETISCKYICDEGTTESPEESPESTESTITPGGGLSDGGMMQIFTAVAFICGVFGWM